jgi:hypothetical protein
MKSAQLDIIFHKGTSFFLQRTKKMQFLLIAEACSIGSPMFLSDNAGNVLQSHRPQKLSNDQMLLAIFLGKRGIYLSFFGHFISLAVCR